MHPLIPLSSASWRLLSTLIVACFIVTVETSPAIKTAAIVSLTVVLWATEAFPLSFTALLFFALCAVGNVVPPQVFLSGMTSPALWLVIAGAIMGTAIQHTGLGQRIARALVPYMNTYQRALLGAGCIGVIFIFIMPSAMGRVILLMPIVLSITEQLGYKNNHHARNGIVLSAVLLTFIPAFAVLPANVVNNVLLGTVHTLFDEHPTYLDYLLLHFPVLGLAKIIVISLIVRWLYSAPAPTISDTQQTPMTRQERGLLAVLAVVVSLWVSEQWHGINTAWVAMIGSVLCLYPGTNLMPEKPLTKLNNDTVFYIAAIVSLGATVYHSGLSQMIADHTLALLPLSPHHDYLTFNVLSLVAMLLSFFVTITSTPAILTPMTADFSALTGWSYEAVYMSQIVGLSTVVLPYQAPPLILAMHMGDIALREVMKVLVVLNVVIVTVLMPLNFLWWWILGMV